MGQHAWTQQQWNSLLVGPRVACFPMRQVTATTTRKRAAELMESCVERAHEGCAYLCTSVPVCYCMYAGQRVVRLSQRLASTPSQISCMSRTNHVGQTDGTHGSFSLRSDADPRPAAAHAHADACNQIDPERPVPDAIAPTCPTHDQCPSRSLPLASGCCRRFRCCWARHAYESRLICRALTGSLDGLIGNATRLRTAVIFSCMSAISPPASEESDIAIGPPPAIHAELELQLENLSLPWLQLLFFWTQIENADRRLHRSQDSCSRRMSSMRMIAIALRFERPSLPHEHCTVAHLGAYPAQDSEGVEQSARERSDPERSIERSLPTACASDSRIAAASSARDRISPFGTCNWPS